MSKTTRREFLKLGLAAAGGALASSGLEIPLFGGKTSSLQTQINNLTTQINTVTGFLTLSVTEQSLLEPVVETIIPSDGTGPGAKEAGVIFFIDHQLAGDYGQSANMFMDGPHVTPTKNSVAVPPSAKYLDLYPSTPLDTNGNIAYSGGTIAPPRVGSGINYQYAQNMRAFWRTGLEALQNYSKSAYSGTFQSLSPSNQLQLLVDLWKNTPTSFLDDYKTSLIPLDFAYELTFMTWAGFLMDPLYGGNQNMVGWEYIGYNGVNFGNAYGEGLSQKDLMVATVPTRLKPASLAQYQQAATGGA